MKEPTLQAKYLISSETHKQCPPADKPEYAFIGRSNVGKSSLINLLTGSAKLASKKRESAKLICIDRQSSYTAAY